MNYIEILPNLIAFIASFTAAIMLLMLAYKMRGGRIGKVVNLLVAGILLSVTVHAVFELASIFNIISGDALFIIMGTLLSVGSLFFIAAGVVGLKND
jgi:hypothetical protein